MTDYEQILHEVTDAVALVTLNRPDEGVGIDLAQWREREGKLFRSTTRHPDSREGTMAFLEKRTPNWSGSVNDEFPDWP